jgi:hypothetical protein
LTHDATARVAAAMDRVGVAIGIHAEHLARAVDPRVGPQEARSALGGVLLLAFLRGFERAAAADAEPARVESRAWLERRLGDVVEGIGPYPHHVAEAVDAAVAATRGVDATARAQLAAERRSAAGEELGALDLPAAHLRRVLDVVADNALALVDARTAEIAPRR